MLTFNSWNDRRYYVAMLSCYPIILRTRETSNLLLIFCVGKLYIHIINIVELRNKITNHHFSNKTILAMKCLHDGGFNHASYIYIYIILKETRFTGLLPLLQNRGPYYVISFHICSNGWWIPVTTDVNEISYAWYSICWRKWILRLYMNILNTMGPINYSTGNKCSHPRANHAKRDGIFQSHAMYHFHAVWFLSIPTWASYQIRKISGCACAGNAGNVSPRRRFQRKPLVSDPGMHHGTCVTHVPWCMSGSLTCGDGENVPGIPGACAPAILRIWKEANEFLVRKEQAETNLVQKAFLIFWWG